MIETMNYSEEFICTQDGDDNLNEQESNQLTQKLCTWIIKHNGRLPSKNKPILSGTFTASGELSYVIDVEEKGLADFLQDRKKAKATNINYYPSDEKILAKNNMDGLFDSKKSKKSHLETNNDNIRALGKFYTDNGGTYPTLKTNLKLINFLNTKRMAYKDFINGTKKVKNKWYPTDEEVARQAGLPSDWIISKEHLQTNDERLRELGKFYVNNGVYPDKKNNLYLQSFLNSKRMAYKNFISGTKKVSNKWYSTDEEVARQAGLPDDWMIPKENLKTNDENLRSLGKFYVDNGKYPTPKTNIDLAKFLSNKRGAYKDFISGTKNYSTKWYPTDEEIAKQAGLPSDWMISKEHLQTNDDSLRALGRFYVDNGGTYPTIKTNLKLRWFLNTKRMAYKNFTRGTGKNKSKWHPTDEEVARQAGLPDGWMVSRDRRKL